ncbi:MAG: four helix bundle protein [Bacteroidales bacterium]|nr:four helix bundle protein [Bacteroidales bacterium]
MAKNNIIMDKSFSFALNIMNYCDKLDANKKFAISNQLIRAGTSTGANIHEAQNAESKLDFIHKLKVAAKEAEETDYWLQLCNEADNYPSAEELIVQVHELKKLLCSIIAKTKRNIENTPN